MTPRPTPERLAEIRAFSDKTIQSWSAMECPKEDMVIDLLAEIDALRAENANMRLDLEWPIVKERDALKAELESV